MKNLLYLFISAFLALSIQSCKRLTDEDGNLLNNTDANDGGLNGPRFLYQEYNSVDTIAEYHYNGLKLVEVVTDTSKVNLSYNGDQVNKISYNFSFSSPFSNGSVTSDRYFNYNAAGDKITTITEKKNIHVVITNPVPPAPIPDINLKSLYTIHYNADNRIDTITMKMGPEIALQQFSYVQYSKTAIDYDIEGNVTKTNHIQGTITNDVFDAPSTTATYVYDAYDNGKSPYSLLPLAYKLYHAIDTPFSYYWLSPNSPKRITASGDALPVSPVVYTTEFTYDPQNYVKSGYNINYDYRPF